MACKLYDYKGEEVTIKYLSELSGLNPNTVRNRINEGFSVEQAIQKNVKRAGTKCTASKKKKKDFTMFAQCSFRCNAK